jgi:hypothetical protein
MQPRGYARESSDVKISNILYRTGRYMHLTESYNLPAIYIICLRVQEKCRKQICTDKNARQKKK